MKPKYIGLLAMLTVALLLLAACGGSSTSTQISQALAQTGAVNVVLSDDATQNWATIGVKPLSISLVPQGGGTPVVVYTAPSTPPMINLVQLDQLGEIIGNANIPVGTYTDAKLTLSANSGDVTLVASAEPEASFDLQPAGGVGQTVPPTNIQIQGATGSAGSKTVQLTVHLLQPLVVTANSSNVLDLEFDLKHPAFVVEHWPASSAAPLWAVNFNGPVRHHPRYDLTRLVLRHTYGQATAVSSDNSTLTITKDFPTYPVPATGQVPISSSISLNIQADATNGTIFYDVDNGDAKSTIKSFASVASSLLNNGNGKYVRIAARYQANGTLVAVRIWASTSFAKVWLSPEGHVLHVNTTSNTLTVCNENGQPVPVTISSSTQFYFRTPQSALADTTPIGTGTAFFDGKTPGGLPDLARGFKVHVAVVDPLASSLTADTVDIEIARYDGSITSPTLSGFNYNRNFVTAMDDYLGTLPYIAGSTANGTDSNGNAISGFYWWYFTFPTLADTGTNAVQDFVGVASNAVTLGTTTQQVWGVSYARWGDGGTTNTSEWYADWAVIEPTPLPLGVVASPWTTITNGISFGMTAAGTTGETPVPIDLSSVSSSATLVYQVNNTGGIVTVTQMDLTNAAQLAAVEQALSAMGTLVKVSGVPTATGAVQAYVIFYYTGTLPATAH
jgi:hypothetical protein